ncbi:MAG: T9SS type A sorting domain-containing protein [Saprospiraceae bacterium]|nr:T9SS type A sorting domain-containing protein [Saprospiraceae bacterium]
MIDINTRSTKKPIINDQNTADIQYHNGILKIDNKNNLNLKYQIISVDGKVLSSGASLFGSDITLNLDIPMGIFFVKVFDDNKTVSKSFIKN